MDETRRRGLEKMNEVYGWEMPNVEGDPYFDLTVDHLFANIWTRPGLSMREKRMMTLTVVTAVGNADLAEIQANAALANGAMIHLLDFDDEIAGRVIHPSAVIFPVVMALAEMNGDTGKAVLNAFTVGCEITSKVGAMLSSPDSAAGAVGASAAAGLMLGLNQEQMENALGLACGGAGGVNAGFASPSRALPQGRAAMNGMSAALLAEKDLIGPGQAIEGPG